MEQSKRKTNDDHLLSLLSPSLRADIEKEGLWDYSLQIPHSMYEPFKRPENVLRSPLENMMPVVWLDAQLGKTECVRTVRLALRLRPWRYTVVPIPVAQKSDGKITLQVDTLQPDETAAGKDHEFDFLTKLDLVVDEMYTAARPTNDEPDWKTRFAGKKVLSVTVREQQSDEYVVEVRTPDGIYPYVFDVHEEAEIDAAAIRFWLAHREMLI